MRKIITVVWVCLLLLSFNNNQSFADTNVEEGTAGVNFNYTKGTWKNGSTLHIPLDYTKLIKLKDGKLIAYSPRELSPTTPQVYDPVSDKWVMLKQSVNVETALPLSDGQALIVDKVKSGYILYIYSPNDNSLKEFTRVSNNWEVVDAVAEQSGQIVFFVRGVRLGKFNEGKQVYNISDLNINSVIQPVRLDLETGKWDDSGEPINIDLGLSGVLVQYNPLTNNEILLTIGEEGTIYNMDNKKQRTVAPNPFNVRALNFAGVLPDGNILFAGGWKDATTQTSDSFIYNLKSDKWSRAASLPGPQTSHANLSLPNGDIMLIGGMNNEAENHYLNTTVIYRAQEKDWVKGPKLVNSRDGGDAALLPNGQIMAVGGITSFKETSLATEILIPLGLQYSRSAEQQRVAAWRAKDRPILEQIIKKNKAEFLKEGNWSKSTNIAVGYDGGGVMFVTINKYSQGFFLKYTDANTTEIYLSVYNGAVSNTSKVMLNDYLKAKGITTNSKINNIINSVGKIQNTVVKVGNVSFSFSRVDIFSVNDDSLKIVMSKN
ncbi:hypothetical protein J2T13_002261 [Paenibacillus sp. DS2015]|uniref:Kelch repeat-containing protein n=1 Tax=Paenibacillus sp. DS2015 TaxID=3373917 RepID=UPI003D214E3D